MRIEAAAYRGKPVYFELIGPWTQHRTHAAVSADNRRTGSSGDWHCFVLFDAGWAARMLARRNLRLGRGRSPWGISSGRCCLCGLGRGLFFVAHHVPNFGELGLFLESLVCGLALSCFLWVLYIALEPYVRRRWPATLVSWSRLLAGGFRDPLVGRDVLAGCLVGAFAIVLVRLGWFVPSWLGDPPAQPHSRDHSGSFWERVQSLRIYRDHLIVGAFLLACVSVCPVSFPGLAAQGVGGSGRIRTLIDVLSPPTLEPVCCRCLGDWTDHEWSDCVSDDPPRLAGCGGSDSFPIFCGSFPLTTQGSAWYAGIESGRDSADGRNGGLRLLYLPGRPAGFRERRARGISWCSCASPARNCPHCSR